MVHRLSMALSKFNTTNFTSLTEDFSHGGNEHDFFRLGLNGLDGDTIQACTNDQVINLWTYIHNGRNADLNGANFDGSVVAQGTRFALDIPEGVSSGSHQLRATISADNASSIDDMVTIACDDHDIELVYDNNLSARQGVVGTDINASNGNMGPYQVWGEPTDTNGALIGFRGGLFPACRHYMLRVTTQVRVVVRSDDVPVPDMDGDLNHTCETGITGSVEVEGYGSANNPAAIVAKLVGTVRGSNVCCDSQP